MSAADRSVERFFDAQTPVLLPPPIQAYCVTVYQLDCDIVLSLIQLKGSVASHSILIVYVIYQEDVLPYIKYILLL